MIKEIYKVYLSYYKEHLRLILSLIFLFGFIEILSGNDLISSLVYDNRLLKSFNIIIFIIFCICFCFVKWQNKNERQELVNNPYFRMFYGVAKWIVNIFLGMALSNLIIGLFLGNGDVSLSFNYFLRVFFTQLVVILFPFTSKCKLLRFVIIIVFLFFLIYPFIEGINQFRHV